MKSKFWKWALRVWALFSLPAFITLPAAPLLYGHKYDNLGLLTIAAWVGIGCCGAFIKICWEKVSI